MSTTKQETKLALAPHEIRYLSNGLAGKGESRTWMQHYVARNGRVLATNGHVLYAINRALPELSDSYASFNCGTLEPTTLKTADPDYAIPEPKDIGRVDVVLDDRAVYLLRLACAAAIGVSEELERRWRREPKKTRSASAPDAAVRIEAGAYGLTVAVYSQDRCALRERAETVKSCAEFTLEVDAEYLKDALDALDEWSLERIVLNVEAGKNASIAPITLRHESDRSALALIVPRRL